MTENEVREKFVAMTDRVGVSNAVEMVKDAIGIEIPNPTFYRARSGKDSGKVTLRLLTYVLDSEFKKRGIEIE